MKRTYQLMSFGFSLLIAFLLTTGCANEENVLPLDDATIDERGGSTASGIPPNSILFGLTANNELVKFSSGPPAIELITMPLKGMPLGETMLAIDFRPRTRQLYGVSSNNIIYLIDKNTGLATPVSRSPFTPEIDGQMVGFDFNPMDDRIRLVTDNDQNLRISPTTGEVVGIDINITPSLVSINSIAYAASTSIGGSISGATSLYDIDVSTGSLFTQNHNAGTLRLVGSLGVNVLSEGGFDAQKGNAWAVFNGNSTSGGTGPGTGSADDLSIEAYRLWSIDLRTGQARSFGQVREMIGLAIPL